MSAPGTGGVVLLAVALLLVVAALASPPGRRAAAAALGSVGRWPRLIRSELRGDAPLDAGELDAGQRRDDTPPEPAPDAAPATRPDIPAVRDEPLPPTRTFPQLQRPGH